MIGLRPSSVSTPQTIDFNEIEVDKPKKEEILNTALFVGGDKPFCVRFYHRSIAEFLAAKVIDKALKIVNCLCSN